MTISMFLEETDAVITGGRAKLCPTTVSGQASLRVWHLTKHLLRLVWLSHCQYYGSRPMCKRSEWEEVMLAEDMWLGVWLDIVSRGLRIVSLEATS